MVQNLLCSTVPGMDALTLQIQAYLKCGEGRVLPRVEGHYLVKYALVHILLHEPTLIRYAIFVLDG